MRLINIKDLVPEPEVAIVVGDTRHAMRPLTVASFIYAAGLVEKLGTVTSTVQELEILLTMVMSGFPTLDEAEVRDWPVATLVQVAQLVQGKTDVVETDGEGEPSGNAPKAS